MLPQLESTEYIITLLLQNAGLTALGFYKNAPLEVEGSLFVQSSSLAQCRFLIKFPLSDQELGGKLSVRLTAENTNQRVSGTVLITCSIL